MPLPYDSDAILEEGLFGPEATVNRIIGANPPLDPWGGDPDATDGSGDKTEMLLNQRGSFGGNTSMSYTPTLFDDSDSGWVEVEIDRTSGSSATSYPTGSTWRMPEAASGHYEGDPTYLNNDCHVGIINRTGPQAGRFLSGRLFQGIDGDAAPMYSAGACRIDREARLKMSLTDFDNPASAPGSGANGSPSTGSGLHVISGTLLPETVMFWQSFETESDDGVRHGLRATAKVANSAGVPLYPAWKTDGDKAFGSTTVRQAQLVYLDATDGEIAAISGPTTKIASMGRMVARMMRKHGIHIADRSGGGFRFYGLNYRSHTLCGVANPWPALLGESTPSLAFNKVTNFPWSKLRVIEVGYTPLVGGSTPPPDPDPDPDPPEAPASHIISVSGLHIAGVVSLAADDLRTSTVVVARSEEPEGDEVDSDPEGVVVTSDDEGVAVGNTTIGALQLAVVADEVKAIPVYFDGSTTVTRLRLPLAGGGPGSGTSIHRGLIMPDNGPANDFPSSLGSPTHQTAEITVTSGEDESVRDLVFPEPVTPPAGWCFIGIHSGGANQVAQCRRTPGGPGDVYKAKGFASGVPTELSGGAYDGVGTNTLTIWAAGGYGGGPAGGTLNYEYDAEEPGEVYLDAYAVGDGGSARLSADEYPVDLAGEAVGGDVALVGSGRMAFRGTVNGSEEWSGDVAYFLEEEVVTRKVPHPWAVDANGEQIRRVRWDEDSDTWIAL